MHLGRCVAGADALEAFAALVVTVMVVSNNHHHLWVTHERLGDLPKVTEQVDIKIGTQTWYGALP